MKNTKVSLFVITILLLVNDAVFSQNGKDTINTTFWIKTTIKENSNTYKDALKKPSGYAN